MDREARHKDDDEQCLEHRLRLSDKEAFETAFEAYYRQIYLLALRYLKSRALAEDVVQEVFLKLWTHRAGVMDSKLQSYLVTITKNHILNVLRSDNRARKRILQCIAPADTHDVSSEEWLIETDKSAALYKAIENLPKRQRVITKLKIYRSLDNATVAAKLKISVNTVKAQYRIALQFLRSLQKKNFTKD